MHGLAARWVLNRMHATIHPQLRERTRRRLSPLSGNHNAGCVWDDALVEAPRLRCTRPRTMQDKRPHSFRAAQALHLARVLQEDYEVTSESLWESLGVQHDRLTTPDARITVAEYDMLIGRALELSGDPAFMLRASVRARATLYGYLGFAVMAASTVREALQLAVELAPGQTDALRLDLLVDTQTAALCVTAATRLGQHHDLVIAAFLLSLASVVEGLTRQEAPVIAELAGARPAGWADEAVPANVRFYFDAPAHRVSMAVSVLDLPVASADPVAKQLALKHCQEQLARANPSDTLVLRAKRLLAEAEAGVDTPSELAQALGVSPRTLRRVLGRANTSYRQLADEARCQRALMLLRHPALSLTEIADVLGFADAASFSRAFMRWTGASPGRYRKDLTGRT